ncbi:MAG: hypothetical protein UT50_C0030G0006 [Candidatus Moranbacteria bacterium GW2011_GWA2_39_41]|nr:MAG: hypothetical protein UT50_C0030G0006 [Candidatus Moranbacteria bacterium GW2011_GWA2_39_41]
MKEIFNFLHAISTLKSTHRFSEIKHENFGDSSADHSWRLALMIFMFAEKLKLDIDTFRAVKIALVHDIAESVTGDIDALLVKNGKVLKSEKQEGETKAIEKLSAILPDDLREEFESLWHEYDQGETLESKFVKALDKIETITHIIEKGCDKLDDFEFPTYYANKTVANVPALENTLHILKEELKKEYEKCGIEWKREYDD